MTPQPLASKLVRSLDLGAAKRVLEPACGTGAFLAALREWHPAASITAVELDPEIFEQVQWRFRHEFEPGGCASVELVCADFFRLYLQDRFAPTFDLIIGNPPFGGSFDPAIEDALDARLGMRFGTKVKKETYAFFIVACVELLRSGGRFVFICSDSLLTIPTMKGLRNFLMRTGKVRLLQLEQFSEETRYPMVVLDFTKGPASDVVERFGEPVHVGDIEATPNLSWGVTAELARLFRGPAIGDYFIGSSGMTTGKNEYFVREVSMKNTTIEPYEFKFYDAPLTVADERRKARLQKLPRKRLRELQEAQARGDTERRIRIRPRTAPVEIALPHPDYRPYNKANGQILFSQTTHVIYWKDEGDAVLTYKRTGNWYLRGVGGQPYFGREGLTWSLVASRFLPRYLPSGCILDSGAPCGFVREGVERREVFFMIGWLLSPLANRILKQVINHTMNIQSKDFERMPYPWWVAEEAKTAVIESVEQMIDEAKHGRAWHVNDDEVTQLGTRFVV